MAQWLWWLGDWARVSPFLKRAAVTTRGSFGLLLLPQFCCFTIWCERLFYYLVHRQKRPRGLLVVSEGGCVSTQLRISLPCSPRAATSASGTAAYFFSQCPLPALCALGASMRCISPRQPDLSSTPTQSLRCSCCSVSLTVWSVLTESTTATK